MFKSLNEFINFHFRISFIFLVLGVFFGVLYSAQILNFGVDIILVDRTRSLHISLMLYGFIPLMLSLLPFSLFDKDNLNSKIGLINLNIYFILWYIFLIFMSISLVFGVKRDLAFYDFDYKLNFILALAGVFYIKAIFDFTKVYVNVPFWVEVSKKILFIAPFALLILMNPQFGQVEASIYGPHGDNTLGMSFALIPIYYLIIKLLAKDEFKLRFNFLWIIPLVFYFISVLERSFISELSYNQEWFYQWLTFLYIPLLLIWLKDAKVKFSENPHIFVSIYAFIFIDIEGNILFIPQIREIFHRNDLVIAHAHIAMALSLFFMAFAIIAKYINIKSFFINYWTLIISIMVLVLSLAGFSQAKIYNFDIEFMWSLRTFSGVVALILLIIAFAHIYKFKNLSNLQIYNLIGFLSDGIGGMILLFFGSFLYSLIGFEFIGGYQYIVFGFVISVGIAHLIAFLNPKIAYELTISTFISRVIVASIFYTLFVSEILDISALLIAIYDISFALVFLILFKGYSNEKSIA